MGFGYEMYFAGQKAQHAFQVYHYISVLLNKNRQVRSIVELGTSMGAMSIYLGLWGARLGIPVHTFDHTDFVFRAEHNIDTGAKPIFDKLGINMYSQLDLFNEEGRALVLDCIGGEPTYLYCDNGNKPQEFYDYVKYLVPGSVVSAHDWPGEIGPEDVQRAVADHQLKLEPWDQENWNMLALASWIVKS